MRGGWGRAYVPGCLPWFSYKNTSTYRTNTAPGDYKTAHSYFLEAFEAYDQLTEPRGLKCLQYMMLCSILQVRRPAHAYHARTHARTHACTPPVNQSHTSHHITSTKPNHQHTYHVTPKHRAPPRRCRPSRASTGSSTRARPWPRSSPSPTPPRTAPSRSVFFVSFALFCFVWRGQSKNTNKEEHAWPFSRFFHLFMRPGSFISSIEPTYLLTYHPIPKKPKNRSSAWIVHRPLNPLTHHPIPQKQKKTGV